MKKQQSGFTLIELVIVIVILGILAAVAVPRFVDLSAEAHQAAIDGIAGGLGSASSINYGGCATKNNIAGAKCAVVAKCSDVGTLLIPPLSLSTTPSAAYYLAADTTSTTNGTAVQCTLKIDVGTTTYTATKTYSAIGAAN